LDEGRRDKTVIPISCLKPGDEKPKTTARPASREASVHGRRSIVCAICGHEITTSDQEIAVDSNHKHVFSNPGGVLFEIGCFSDAWGAFVHGDATDEFSWFPGHRWCYASCSGCLTHLGWHFFGNGSNFWGLILNRLAPQLSDYPQFTG